MENLGSFLNNNWQYLTLILGIGFIVFGIFCNRVKLLRYFTKHPDATYSLGLRIVYVLLGISAVLYSCYSILL